MHRTFLLFLSVGFSLQGTASQYRTAVLNGVSLAQTRIYDLCRKTDLQYAPGLSQLLNNRVYIKCENQQPVFSFKLRGAHNKIASLTKEQLKRGIITCSAGNHAQGVAYSASRLGVANTIVMPVGTPQIKVDAVKRFGGTPLLHGENFDAAQQEALRLAKEQNITLVHPFDDLEVISGQGTIGAEIAAQLYGKETLDAVFCAVGGGGLLAGVSAYLKATLPMAKMIGVEACDAACMTRSLEAGLPITLDSVGLFADGAAVRRPGNLNFAIVQENVDGMVTVKTDAICAAIKAAYNDTRTILEPAGALAIAGLVQYVTEHKLVGKTLVAVASGANMDFDRLRFVSERADSKERLVACQLPEQPGALWEFYQEIFPRNVTEFSYRIAPQGRREAHLLIGFKVKDDHELDNIIDSVEHKPGFAMRFVGDDEFAKTHLRHLAGGRAGIKGERVFRFEFPERPGALRIFLKRLFARGESEMPFNITAFHYRSHGDDVGKVFIGFQTCEEEREFLERFLNQLAADGFSAIEETKNSFYQEFLQ